MNFCIEPYVFVIIILKNEKNDSTYGTSLNRLFNWQPLFFGLPNISVFL